MTNRIFTTEEKLSRWEDQREIKNLMGRMSADYTLKKEREMPDKYWSAKDDICLGINEGYFTGQENVRAYYKSEGEKIALESKLIQAAFPEELGDKTEEEIYGVGMMTYRPVDTPVIELSEDGETAKGIWCIRGSYSTLTPGGPMAYWEWGWFAVDFVRENSEWKIWHMLYFREVDRPCGRPWVGEIKEYTPRPEFSAIKEFKPAEPNIKRDLHCLYSNDRRFSRSPRVPEPYKTFSETFSYGL